MFSKVYRDRHGVVQDLVPRPRVSRAIETYCGEEISNKMLRKLGSVRTANKLKVTINSIIKSIVSADSYYRYPSTP